MPVENRQSSRVEVRYIAWIDVGDGLPLRNCIMRDISASGAKLGIITSTPNAIPNEFTLLLSTDGGVRHRCRVAWRSDQNMGVEFLHPSKPVLVSKG
jgi:hypothetical protein